MVIFLGRSPFVRLDRTTQGQGTHDGWTGQQFVG